MGNCLKAPIKIKEITKVDKSIQCNIEDSFIISSISIREIERGIDELLDEEFNNDIDDFLNNLILE